MTARASLKRPWGSTPAATHPSLRPLQRAASALAQGDLAAAQLRLELVSQQLAARAALMDDDLRHRQQALAQRFAKHAQSLQARQASRVVLPAPLPATGTPAPPAALALPAGVPAPSVLAEGECLTDMVCPEPLRQLLMSRFVMPLSHPAEAARYRQSARGGLLLFGPPGTGKTHLVRALARELAVPVFSVSPAKLLSKWLGESEKQLAELFAQARRVPAALVFIDEIDVVAPRRDAMDQGAGGPLQRLMAQLLTELDGFAGAEGRVMFVGATNRPWVLDEALLRPGRFDAMAYVGLPDAAARSALLSRALEGVPVQGGLPWALAARALADRSAAETLACAGLAARRAFERTVHAGAEQALTLDDLLQAARATPAAGSADDAAFRAFARRHGAVWSQSNPAPTDADGAALAKSPDDEPGDESPPMSGPWTAPEFEPLRFVQARDLHLELETLPFVSYALQHAGLAPVRQISLSNQGSEDSQNLLIEVAMVPADLGEAWSTTLPALPAGQIWHSGPLTLPLRLERLRAVLEKEQAHLRITVRDRDEVLLARTESLPVLAYNEWVYLPRFLALTAAYVQPNHPALHPVVQAAAQRLGQTTGSAAFSGYQVGGAARVQQMLSAVHDTLAQDLALDYINPPPSFEHSGQKVRLVADTLAQGRGTCLDLALLQAALWEHIGLQPLLVLVPGHALLACWLHEADAQREAVTTLQAGRGGRAARQLQDALNQGRLRLVNSVEVAHRQELDAAQHQGLQILRQTLKDGHAAQFIDVAACRNEVTPLP